MGDIIDQSYLLTMFDRTRIANLTNDNGGGAGSTTIITNVIAAAESQVFALLSKQYTLAQLAADAGIKREVAIHVMYMLELRRSDVSKGIAEAYSASLMRLQQLIEGNAKLSGVEQVLPRITQTNAQELFEAGGYFSGLPQVGDDTGAPDPVTS